jgi:hypothetical protein
MAVKKEHIGSTHYSKILDRNISIREDMGSDDYFNLIGLGYILEEQKPTVKEPEPSKKKNDSDK